MILSDVLRRYDFELTPGQTIEARPMVILRPKHGIRMTFTNVAQAHRPTAQREPLLDKNLSCPVAGH
jgi:hypothetical protein